MHLVLTGATGLVGTAVLDAMIKTKDVTKISILTRRPVAMADAANDPRINVVIHKDFGSYDPEVLGQLKGATGCVWALGISQTKVSKEEYVKITKDYALEAAKAFASLPSDPQQPFRFVYVSGEGATHSPGLVTPIFGRVKGETELALADMRRANPLLRADTMRPGGVDPSGHDAITPFIPPWTGIQRLVGAALLPVLRTVVKSQMSPTEPLGKFLVEMAMGKWDGRMSGPGVTELGESRVVSNAAFRRLAGL